MNRNAQSRFAVNPTNIDMSRSKFSRSSSVKTSFNTGQVIPFYLDEVLPGDTFNIKTSKVVRLQTLITPMMDNLYLDTYFFFVPNRIVWEHWQNLMGENTQSAWIPSVEYEVPQVTAPTGGWEVGTIADYFGIPIGVAGLSVNALPFRAYALIMNDWFRDQNLSDPLNIPVNDTTIAGVNTGNYVTDVVKGGKPFMASKYYDYFTGALPSPQKSADVTIGLGGDVPVYGSGSPLAIQYHYSSQNEGIGYLGMAPNYHHSDTSAVYPFLAINSSDSYDRYPNDMAEAGTSVYVGRAFSARIPTESVANSNNLDDVGLVANLNAASSVSINQLRMAFQIQKLYEKDARGGTRYIEVLKTHFGVTSPDARLQRPEYLGGNRIPIRVNQVVQQSATGEGSTPQGNVSGMSLTTDTHSDFTKSFVEHGFVIGVMVARYDHTYQQGLQRLWSRKDRFDYYWPVLANIGEQPILNKEIYAQGSSADDEVFGYQEAWADYRYKPSIVTGEMRSQAATSLDSWHLADDYDSLPMLSDSWIREDPSNVDRVLAVSSSVSNQLFADIFVQNYTTRPMPMYSIPGLIDHH